MHMTDGGRWMRYSWRWSRSREHCRADWKRLVVIPDATSDHMVPHTTLCYTSLLSLAAQERQEHQKQLEILRKELEGLKVGSSWHVMTLCLLCMCVWFLCTGTNWRVFKEVIDTTSFVSHFTAPQTQSTWYQWLEVHVTVCKHTWMILYTHMSYQLTDVYDNIVMPLLPALLLVEPSHVTNLSSKTSQKVSIYIELNLHSLPCTGIVDTCT